jgi:hypothetical protein
MESEIRVSVTSISHSISPTEWAERSEWHSQVQVIEVGAGRIVQELRHSHATARW